MKTTRLAITLAALTTSASFALAQNDDVIRERAPVPPPPPDAPVEALAAHEAQLASSKDHLKQAERALASSQKAMELAQAQAGDAKALARTIGGGGGRSGGASRTLVIPKDAGDAKNLAEVEEDMNVMAHILDKAASEDRKSGRAMGIPVFGRFSFGGGSPQNLYIEGSGALFFLNVNYPLQPTPDKGPVTDTKEKAPSEWDEAKKEMARPGGGGADAFFAFGENFERNFVWDGGASSPYDADKVEDLKSALISALKNVANIRKLKSDETVTVVVTGASAIGSGGKTIKTTGAKPAAGRDEEMVAAELRELKAGVRGPASAPAKLVLRVRKSDSEAFQNGNLNLDDFKKKVTGMIY
jgi:hypothetical protein